MVPLKTMLARHAALLQDPDWLIEGLGPRESIAERLERATEIILGRYAALDAFWFAVNRQTAWTAGALAYPSAGLTRPPPTCVGRAARHSHRAAVSEARRRATALVTRFQAQEIVMMTRFLPSLGLAGLLAIVSLSPALAQAADQSPTCRLFPLACPGSVPPVPTPLLGPPEDQAEAAPPAVATHAVKAKRHAHKPVGVP